MGASLGARPRRRNRHGWFKGPGKGAVAFCSRSTVPEPAVPRTRRGVRTAAGAGPRGDGPVWKPDRAINIDAAAGRSCTDLMPGNIPGSVTDRQRAGCDGHARPRLNPPGTVEPARGTALRHARRQWRGSGRCGRRQRSAVAAGIRTAEPPVKRKRTPNLRRHILLRSSCNDIGGARHRSPPTCVPAPQTKGPSSNSDLRQPPDRPNNGHDPE